MNKSVLETPRLILRLPEPQDFDPWAALTEDEENARFIGGAIPRAAAWRMMASVIGAQAMRGFTLFSIIEKESGQWMGWAGPWQPEGWPGREIGWTLAKAHWGKGYATEAASAALAYAFETLGWEDVIHCIHPFNAKSIAVALRIGSKLLSHELVELPPPSHDAVAVFGQKREDWQARRGA